MRNLVLIIIAAILNITSFLSSKLGGGLAFYLFCLPFKVKLGKSQQEFLNTSKKFTLDVGEIKLQCYKWGSGPRKILLVHGWQSNTYRWRKYIETLSPKEFSVFGFDAPGHGNSGSLIGNVPLYERSIAEIHKYAQGFEIIMAHSIGSFSTWYFMHLHPNKRPQKMISLASPYSAKEFMDFYIDKLGLSKKTLTSFEARFKRYTGEDISYFSLDHFLKENRTETLVIHDNIDEVVKVSFAKRINQSLPNSKLIITNGLGHKLKGEEVIKAVSKFLD